MVMARIDALAPDGTAKPFGAILFRLVEAFRQLAVQARGTAKYGIVQSARSTGISLSVDPLRCAVDNNTVTHSICRCALQTCLRAVSRAFDQLSKIA